MQKILIIGSGGAGKSTLSREIGKILDLPIIHLDRLFWRPGWVETPRDEWIKVLESETSRPRWIMDGNYDGTMDLRLSACDSVIFLNFTRWLCLRRVIGRSLRHRFRARPDMTEGCNETFDLEYLKFLRWIWTYPTVKAPTVLEKLKAVKATKNIFVLCSPLEADKFLETLRAGKEPLATE